MTRLLDRDILDTGWNLPAASLVGRHGACGVVRLHRRFSRLARLHRPHCHSWSRGAHRSQRVLDLRAGSAMLASAQPLHWRGLIRFSSDRIHKAVVETLAVGFTSSTEEPGSWAADRELGQARPFEAGGGKDLLRGRLGFRLPLAPGEQTLLTDYRSQLIKLQFALWARAFAETDAAPGRPVVVTLAQLCEDLGYRRLQNGAHRPEHKRQVAALFALLTRLELDAEYTAPDGRRVRLAGPLWQRFPEQEQERSFAYAPGPWAADPVWSRYNRRVALIGAGLLSLRPDRDRWAISVGAYLACLARMNGYRPLTLRVETLVQRCGLLTAERRNPGRMREMLERALDQLEATGLIAQWDWHTADPREPDMDSPTDLARLSAQEPNWLQRSLVIRWPAQLQQREAALRPGRERLPSNRRTTRTRTATK